MEIVSLNPDLNKYLLSLEKPTRSKIAKQLKLLEEFGSGLGMPYSKQVAKNLHELRIRGNQEVRIFYTFHTQKVYLLHAFVKKSNKTPPKEIKIALKRIRSLT